jgi:hypothetical protein
MARARVPGKGTERKVALRKRWLCAQLLWGALVAAVLCFLFAGLIWKLPWGMAAVAFAYGCACTRGGRAAGRDLRVMLGAGRGRAQSWWACGPSGTLS